MATSKPTVILDFDGTVADSFDMALDIAQTLLAKYHYPAWTKAELMKLRELSAAQLIKTFKTSPRHIPGMVRYIRREQKTRISTVKPIAGIAETLKELSAPYNLAIVSSSDAKLIEEFLIKYKLSTYIEDVIGGAGVFQKHRAIRKYMKQKGLASHAVLYVGDEVRDIDAARHAKIAVVSVNWGFNGEKALRRAKPDKLARSPAQLVTTVAELLPLQTTSQS